jgi:hypothetical protein
MQTGLSKSQKGAGSKAKACWRKVVREEEKRGKKKTEEADGRKEEGKRARGRDRESCSYRI